MSKKTLITILVGALIASAFTVGPADARKKKKKKKPPVCAEYVPGEMGAEAETFVVTDEATEEEPATLEGAALEPGIIIYPPAELPGHSYYNIQVDTKKPEAGLYVLMEWAQPVWDYDLWAYKADGTEAASAHGFNPVHPTLSGENNGGESGATFEKIVGLKAADCEGFTLDLATAHGPGGAVSLTYWLGDVQHDPAAE